MAEKTVKNKIPVKPAKTKKKPGARSGMNMILIAIICLIALIVSSIVIYGYINGEDADTVSMDVYFINTATDTLQAETRKIKLSGSNEDLSEALRYELITVGPKNAGLRKSVPDSVTVTNLSLQGDEEKSLFIYMDGGYNSLSLTDALLCRAGLVWTFTGLNFVDNIQFFVNGEELARSDGQPYGMQNRENVRLDSGFSSKKAEYQKITLYFADEQGRGLVAEERDVIIDPNYMEKGVMQELLKGSNTGLVSVIPSDIKINDIKTEDKTCTVDLGADFLSKLDPSSTGQRLAIYSIVNSLCEISRVSRVQFLIDGKKVSGAQIDMSAPFEKNEDIIIDRTES